LSDGLIVVATRRRPAQFGRLVHAIKDTGEQDMHIAVAVDDDDLDGYNQLYQDDEVVRERVEHWYSGPRNNLVGWTNHIVKKHLDEYPVFASFGDDHVPRTQGWDTLLLEAMGKLGGTGIVYGDDLLQRQNLCTAPMVSADIVAALKWLFEPGLSHYFGDNVLMDLGNGAGCLAYVEQAIIEHCHPVAGKAPMDQTYAEAGSGADVTRHPDYAVYKRWQKERFAFDVAKVKACVR
jgi:hypothetical protein